MALDGFLRDLRHACRRIASMPALAAVVIASLAVGIGVNTVVFSWIQARLLRPIPGVASGASFVWIEPRTDAGLYPAVSWLEYRDLSERLRSFRELLAFRMAPLYVGEPGNVERAYGQIVSGNYFSGLGLRPAIGRFPTEADVTRSRPDPVVVISHGLWQKRFAGASNVIGRSLRVNAREVTIVGVAPRAFQGTVTGLNFELWIPATLAPSVLNGSRELDDRSIRAYSVMGRLRTGTTRAQAQGELDTVMRQLARTYPATNSQITGEVLSFTQSPRGPQRLMNTALLILQAVMLLLLLAVCGNAANLVLARASARQREMGVRLALGAGRWRVTRLLLVENVLLAVAGALGGALIAVWGTKALLTLPLTGLPLKLDTTVDGWGLAFAMSLGVACGLLFGAAPALQFARLDAHTAFRRGSTAAGRSRTRNALMAVQVGLALVVLLIAGVFLRSFMETRDTDPGFRREGILLAAYDLSGRNLAPPQARVFAARLLDRLGTIPGVERVAISSSVPLDIHGLPSRVFTVEGHARDDGGFDRALTNTVTPGYFEVMGIPLRSGSDFGDLKQPGDRPQAIVNEAFVRRYLQKVEPLGRRLEARGRTYVIGGIVGNSISNAFGEPPTPVIYFSYRDATPAQGEVHLRTRPGTETTVAPQVRRLVRELDPEVPVYNVRTLTDHVETNLVFRRIPARMFAVLGPLLLLLAAVGVYAVVAYAVSLRTAEIGVRLALGATEQRVIGQFLAQSLRVIAIGATIGWVVAFVIALRVLPGNAIDVRVFAGVPALLLSVAALACWIPARRAARVDPVLALRAE
jgi:predicted permease